ncbi:hypothetical protein [Enterococcus faecalis]|uniref:hypothetical protein n=1 Tax=Enterococcus faecalis TaxID=1351 RepID=UPI003DA13604
MAADDVSKNITFLTTVFNQGLIDGKSTITTEYIQADDYERSEKSFAVAIVVRVKEMAIMSETLRLVWVHSN